MDYSVKKPFGAFIEEERKTVESSSSSQNLDQKLSPSRSNSAPNAAADATAYSLMPPPSPDSPWTLSPIHRPSPCMLYNCIASIHRQEGTIYSISASKGVVFTGSDSSHIRVWHQPECIERWSLKSRSGDVRAIVSHGDLLFTSHKDCRVRVWNVTISEIFKAEKVSTLPGRWRPLFLKKLSPRLAPSTQTHHKDVISCMAYYHAEGILYTGSWDRTVKAWRVLGGKCIDSFQAHDKPVNGIVVNQINGHIFTCSSDGSVKIWTRLFEQNWTHTLTMRLNGIQHSPVNALAISSSSPTSCFLYSGSSDGFINFWEKERLSGRFNHGGFLQGHRFSVLCLVAIDKLVFSGSEDTTIRVWKREEGSCLHECFAVLEAHRGPVSCLAASLERDRAVMGCFLVYSAGLDRAFKAWRVKLMPDGDSGPLIKYKISSPVLSPSWVEKKLQGGHQS